MKKNLLAVSFAAGALIMAGCGKKEESTAGGAPAAASGEASAVVTVELTASDAMKFNLTKIEARPGQQVKVILTNIGTMPKAAMGHNFILLKQGVDPKAVVDAAVTAAATDYIPASMADKIIAHTKLLGPKQSDEITFTAPTEPGDYTFLCSFPAHFLSGMHGVLTVK